MSTSEPYILNRVQQPELVAMAYRSISGGNTDEESLAADTGLDGNRLEQAIQGLALFGVGGKSDFELFVNELPVTADDWELSFRASVLHNLAQTAAEPPFEKRAAVQLTFRYFLEQNQQYFESRSATLIDAIDEYHQAVGFEPMSQQGRSKLNEVKLVHWTRHASYLGLVHHARQSAYTVYPDPDVVLRGIELAIERAGNSEGMELLPFAEWFEENFLSVPLTPEREFPEPVARVLYDLTHRGDLELGKRGDAPRVGLSNVPVGRNENVSKDANYIRVTA